MTNDRTKVLFFSRGRGHGHAIPDMALTAEAIGLDPGLEFQFCSYATGAETFRKKGVSVTDLLLPEDNDFFATLLACQEVIESSHPTVVIAHEEFAAIAAAKLSKIPSIFISAWLPPSKTLAAEVLAYTSAIIVIGSPGLFPVPYGVPVIPFYTGPLLRKMELSVKDRPRIRSEMGLSRDAICISVVPGGAATEASHPIAGTVIEAFERISGGDKRLVWVSDNDYDTMNARRAAMPSLEVHRFYDPIERLIVASDLVITKGTRGITFDAAALGIPTISLSPGTNPIDDIIVSRVPSNIALNANAVDAAILSYYIDSVLGDRMIQPPADEDSEVPSALGIAAKKLVEDVRRLEVGQRSNGAAQRNDV